MNPGMSNMVYQPYISRGIKSRLSRTEAAGVQFIAFAFTSLSDWTAYCEKQEGSAQHVPEDFFPIPPHWFAPPRT